MAADAAQPQGAAGWAEVLGNGRMSVFVLICLSVWLSAADSLVTATIMPSVGRSLGGYAYFGWATALYLLGSVTAGASAGLLAQRFGLQRGTCAAALLYAAGCVLSAAAPDMLAFLLGRAAQGIGGGWVVGFSSVCIGLLFPNRTLPKVYASISSVWGVASLVGPLIGGAFADAGAWRGAFWCFAVQGAGVAAASLVLLPEGAGDADTRVAWRQLGMVVLAVAAIAAADLAGGFAPSAGLTLAGVVLLLGMVWFDERASVRLLPPRAGDVRSVTGAGFAAQFLLIAASMGYSIYGPAVLQTLAGLGSLAAGYVVASEAAAWTIASLSITNLTGPWPGRMIRLGAASVVAGVCLQALLLPTGSVTGAVLAGVVMGAGFGMSWSFMSQRILASLSDRDRATGSAGMNASRLTGYACGAAVAAAAANLSGMAEGLTADAARATGFWVFAVMVPVAGAGLAAAWRVGRGNDGSRG